MADHREAPPKVRAAWAAAQSDPTLKKKLMDDPQQALIDLGIPHETVADLLSTLTTKHMTEEHWNHWTSPAHPHEHEHGHADSHDHPHNGPPTDD